MRILLGCREVTPREDIDTPTLRGSQFPEFAQNPLHPSGRGGVECLLAFQASAARLHADRLGTGFDQRPDAATSATGGTSATLAALSRYELAVHDMEAACLLLPVVGVEDGHSSRRRLMVAGGFHMVGGTG